MSTPTTQERRDEAIVDAIVSMIRELAETHLAKIERAAAQSTGNADAPPEAKVSFAVAWPAGSLRPDVTVKLSYGVRITEEADRVVDPDQMELPITQ
jgi:hypothetical protein